MIKKEINACIVLFSDKRKHIICIGKDFFLFASATIFQEKNYDGMLFPSLIS